MEYVNFPEHEVACKCCGFNNIDRVFMANLVQLRLAADFPFPMNSMCRCDERNEAEGGSEDSAHLLGMAGDIQLCGERALWVISNAKNFGFTGVGIKQHGARKRRFVHLDTAYPTVHRPRPWVWTYAR